MREEVIVIIWDAVWEHAAFQGSLRLSQQCFHIWVWVLCYLHVPQQNGKFAVTSALSQ